MKIILAAIREISTGKIHQGVSHPIIADGIIDPEWDEEELIAWNDSVEDGFLTDSGFFLTRDHTLQYALATPEENPITEPKGREIHSGNFIAIKSLW